MTGAVTRAMLAMSNLETMRRRVPGTCIEGFDGAARRSRQAGCHLAGAHPAIAQTSVSRVAGSGTALTAMSSRTVARQLLVGILRSKYSRHPIGMPVTLASEVRTLCREAPARIVHMD